MTFFSHMTDVQFKCWNEGLNFHPNCLSKSPYEAGSEEYTFFEDGWWYADNEESNE